MKKWFKKGIIVIMFVVTLSLSFNVDAKTNFCAKSYVLMESSSKRVLDGENIDQRMLTASIAKIMTAIVVIENCNIDEYVLVDQETISQVGSAIYLELNDLICIRDLLYGLMLNSGNDASISLAIGLTGNIKNFVYLMNEMAAKIGMKNSNFVNPSGLEERNGTANL